MTKINIHVIWPVHKTQEPVRAIEVSSGKVSIDDAPLNAFHTRLVTYSCGGPFCDGYILGVIAIALVPLSKDLGLTPGREGLIAAASLVGMFIGGAVFGYVTDLVGRQVMYTLDLILLVVASVAQLWVWDLWSLFALRFALGLAIGADYPIVSALLSEFAPRRQRGRLLGAMIGAWWVGYSVSFISAYCISFLQISTWRWMLASSALPAAIVAVMRWGTPESPRWLASKGRVEEARTIVQKHIGPDCELEDIQGSKTDFAGIFRAPYGRSTLFVCMFWSCQIMPTFAIYTFAPDLLTAFGSTNPTLGAALLSIFFVVGVIPGILLVDRVGRRPLLLVSFAVTGLALVALALTPRIHTALIAVFFIVFSAFSAGGGVLQWIYPSELFPTELRATALGFGTSVSRIGAAIGTFLFPIGLLRLGVSNLMWIVGGVCIVGWVLSLRLAPETRGLALSDASGGAGSSSPLRLSARPKE